LAAHPQKGASLIEYPNRIFDWSFGHLVICQNRKRILKSGHKAGAAVGYTAADDKKSSE